MKSVFLLFLFLIPLALANCSENQIDLNSAPLEDLDKLSGVGPVYAQRIIDSRPYSAIDDLLNLKGIGPATLEKINSQGLACISGSREELSSHSITSANAYSKADTSQTNDYGPREVPTENIINLNSGEVISNSVQKEEIIFESKNEKVKRYLIFVFAFFLILIILFLLLTR